MDTVAEYPINKSNASTFAKLKWAKWHERKAQEALQAQSAQIDGVSGATYTSQSYAQSLQSALDSAGI